jgi:hypothetical protein
MIERLPELAPHKVVFDGRCNAYAPEELSFDKLTRQVELPDAIPAKAASTPTRKKNEFTVKFCRVAKIELEELHRFLNREGPVTPSCFTAIQGVQAIG